MSAITGELLGVGGAPARGTVIGDKYRVLDVFGSGGMGCLAKAEHLLLKKTVAVKFVLATRSGSARKRLFREARAAQALVSEHVVRVFDVGVHEGAPYIVMELLEGRDLAAMVADEGPLSVEAAVDSVLEACVAVAEAHELGIIHRDIKPANLFATRTASGEVVKVLDFGISKVPEPMEDDCDKTAEDTVLGTPHYTSPEQLRNPTRIDGRTDVWAFGVTLFFLLTGEHPFTGTMAREVTAAIFTDPPNDPRARRPELPEALCQVIFAALAKRPEERTASIKALARELEPFASKRGRLAIERTAAMIAQAADSAPAPRAPAEPLSTTDEGLSATLPGSGRAPASLRQPPAPRRPTGRVMALGALTLSGALVLGWLWRPTTTHEARADHAVGKGSARMVGTVAPAASPLAPRATPAAPAVPADPAPRVQPRRNPAPRARASATLQPAPSAHDIDGVPIVE